MSSNNELPVPAAIWTAFAAVNGLVAVAAGAFGRHANLDAFGREVVEIGSHYQMAHALALFGVAWLATRTDRPLLSPVHVAGAMFTVGTILFSGSLYWLGVTGAVLLEGGAPVGGYLLMLGWLSVGVAALRTFTRKTCLLCRGEAISHRPAGDTSIPRETRENEEAGF